MEIPVTQQNQPHINNLTLYLKETCNPYIKELIANHHDWVKDNTQVDIKHIEDEAQCQLYIDKLDYAKRALKTIETRRLEITKPLREAVDATNKFIKSSLENDLNLIVNNYNTLVINYKKKKIEEERKRQEEERKRIEALKEETARKLAEQNKLNAQVMDNLNNTVEQAIQIVNQQAEIDSRTKINTSNGSVNITSRFVFDEEKSQLMQLLEYIVRENPLALKYVQFNLTEINKDLRPTKERPEPRKIKGIEFKEEFNTRSNA